MTHRLMALRLGTQAILDGSGAADSLAGGADADVLNGLSGADTLAGAGGDDLLRGGNGSDRLYGGDGTDTLEGGAGNDTAVFVASSFDYRFALAGGRIKITDLRAGASDPDGVDFVSAVETLQFADTAFGVATRAPQVNIESAGAQSDAAVGALADGGYVIAWATPTDAAAGWSIRARLHDAGGAASEIELQVSSDGNLDHAAPAVSGLADGGFVLAWEAGHVNAQGQLEGRDVFLRRFDAAGEPLGDEVAVATVGDGEQLEATVSALGNGGFVVSWVSSAAGTGGELLDPVVKARVFDAAGEPLDVEFSVGDGASTIELHPSATALAGGGFVLAWVAAASTDVSGDLMVQRFHDDGTPLGNAIRVNTAALAIDAGQAPAITALSDGGFAVAWSTHAGGASADVYARVYDDAGTPDDVAFRINRTTAGEQTDPRIAELAGRDILVSWQSEGQDGSGTGVYARGFATGGEARDAADVRVNNVTAGDQGNPALAALGDGGVVLAWQSAAQDGSASGIFMQRYHADNDAMRIELRGTAGNDVLALGGTQPMHAEGLEGDDIYIVTRATDVVVERPDEGFDRVFASLDWIAEDNVEQVVLVGTAPIGVTGNIAANWLVGNESGNHVSGREGDDTLDGGRGRDNLSGGDGSDLLDGGDDDDSLDGGAGADSLRGGGGNDEYGVDDEGDIVLEDDPQPDGGDGIGGDAIGDNIDTVIAQISYTLTANVENLTLATVADLTGNGNELANILLGNAGGNQLDGLLGNDTLRGGAGGDTVDGGGGADRLLGDTGSDLLRGGPGADVLIGGSGTDQLAGGAGNDRLTGGIGQRDVFVFDSSLAGAANVDRIADFESGLDLLRLRTTVFDAFDAGLSPTLDPGQFLAAAGANAAEDASQRIVYDTSTGSLYYDADGVGGVAAVRFAQLAGAPVLDAADFLIVA